MRQIKFNGICISDRSEYMLTSINGQDTGAAVFQRTEYVDMDGADYVNPLYSPRPLEVYGTIFAETARDLDRLKRKLMTACNAKRDIDLYYDNGYKLYYAKAIVEQLPSFVKVNNCTCEFVVYITVPRFYWLAASASQQYVFYRMDKISGSFTLPCVFTERLSRSVVKNGGDVPVYPIFTLVCEASVDSVTVQNHTNDGIITLNRSLTAGESIEIDCENGKVTSSISGNILNSITADSDFFALDCGENDIECTATGVTLSAQFNERFVGVS